MGKTADVLKEDSHVCSFNIELLQKLEAPHFVFPTASTHMIHSGPAGQGALPTPCLQGSTLTGKSCFRISPFLISEGQKYRYIWLFPTLTVLVSFQTLLRLETH